MLPFLDTIIGVPDAEASRGVKLKPSARYGETYKSLALYIPFNSSKVRFYEIGKIEFIISLSFIA